MNLLRPAAGKNWKTAATGRGLATLDASFDCVKPARVRYKSLANGLSRSLPLYITA